MLSFFAIISFFAIFFRQIADAMLIMLLHISFSDIFALFFAIRYADYGWLFQLTLAIDATYIIRLRHMLALPSRYLFFHAYVMPPCLCRCRFDITPYASALLLPLFAAAFADARPPSYALFHAMILICRRYAIIDATPLFAPAITLFTLQYVTPVTRMAHTVNAHTATSHK